MVIATAACSGSVDGGHLCTALYAYITVTARDVGGNAVAGLTISDTVLRTHEALEVLQSPDQSPPNRYIIFTDGMQSHIRTGGDSVRVAGTKPGASFVADYVFDTPEGCHIHKVSGPDTVVVTSH